MNDETIPVGSRVVYTATMTSSENGLKGCAGQVIGTAVMSRQTRYIIEFENGRRLDSCRRGNLELIADEVELEVESYL